MDYRFYRLCMQEKVVCLAKAAGFSVVIAYLFYQHWMGLILTPILYILIRKRTIRERQAARQEQIATQFLDALRTVSASLLAGYSMENAWREAAREVENLYGKDAILLRELEEINRAVALNIPIEKLLDQFADRSGNADIMSFAEVFAFAKRSGGNFAAFIPKEMGNFLPLNLFTFSTMFTGFKLGYSLEKAFNTYSVSSAEASFTTITSNSG